MKNIKKPYGYWTKDKCQEEALKYNTKKDFKKGSKNSYDISVKKKWINDICNHMIILVKSKNYWNKEKCQKEALKYNTKKEFQQKCISAYIASRKNGWLNEITSHMIEFFKPDGYWTKDRCQEEALKYNTKIQFIKKSYNCYLQCWLNNWLEEICSHMIIIGHKYKRCIYVYEFFNNSAYIGLTYNLEKRHNEHLSNKNSIVYKKINEGLKYELKKLIDYIDVEKSIEYERYYVEYYKKNNWNILNKNKTGGLGKCSSELYSYIKNKENL